MSEYIVDFGETSSAFVGLAMAEVRAHGAELCEPIVRCKDCEFAAYEGKECMRIDEWDGSMWFPVEPDGFCAWGERRES